MGAIALDDVSYAKFVDALKELTDIGNSLGKATTEVQAEISDPVVMSMVLFTRAWTNFRGVQSLWQADLILEAEIILRSLIETAICLANLDVRREDFIKDLGEDLSHTMHGAVRMMRKAEYDFADVIEKDFADVLEKKGEQLRMETLATQASVPDLYSFHRVLSGAAAHITGVSIARHSPLGGLDEETTQKLEDAAKIDRRRVILWTIPAMIAATMAHARIIENAEHAALAEALSAKLGPEIEKYAANNGIEIVANS